MDGVVVPMARAAGFVDKSSEALNSWSVAPNPENRSLAPAPDTNGEAASREGLL